MDTLETKTYHGKRLDGKMIKKLKSLFKSEKAYDVTDKEAATARGEPYINVVRVNFDENRPGDGYFELDWNELFVRKLQEAGYTGQSQEELVDAWFTQLCRGIADQEY